MSAHYHFCYTCQQATPPDEMVPYGVWSPEARRTLRHLACPCGEREDLVDAYPCERCEGHFPEPQFETGSDLCIKCAAAKFGVH